MSVKVINKSIVKNMNELLELFDVSKIMPDHSEKEFIELMYNIYGKELDKKQIVAIEFEYLSFDGDVKLIEYNEKYLEDVKDLLVELEEYIISIDKDYLDQLHSEYREKKALLDLEEVSQYNGKCYLAIESDRAIGLIMVCIPKYDDYDYLDYKCPKRCEITELIVTSKTRNKGIGQLLINKMEQYFKSVGCEYVIVDVFAYNEIGKNFYSKNKYHARGEIRIKKID